jgi:xanthine dehydrogenase accessory factor
LAVNVMERAVRLQAEGVPFVLATVTWRRAPSSGKQGSKAIIHADGTVDGWMGGACSQPTIVRHALKALEDGSPRILVLGETDRREGVVAVAMACSSEGAMEVYVEPVVPAAHLHVVGSSPMVETLRRLASALEWRVSAVDEPSMVGVGPSSFVVVATQGHYDEPAVEAALRTGTRYVGLVASAKRAAQVVDHLRHEGVDDESLTRLYAPAGLDLGHIDHEEIAVAIMAELVALKAKFGSSATTKVQMPEQATDPVCRMTVDVASARWMTEHEGTAYYFCAPGCMAAFKKDPSAFLVEG